MWATLKGEGMQPVEGTDPSMVQGREPLTLALKLLFNS